MSKIKSFYDNHKILFFILLAVTVGMVVLAFVSQAIFTWIWRYAIIAAVVLAVLWLGMDLVAALRRRRKQSDFDAQVAAREGVEDRKREWAKWMGEMRQQGIDRYALPFYLLVGEPQSGKSVMLQNSGLNFPFGQSKLSGPGGTRGCDWWFTEEAVILDLAGRLFVGEGSDEAEWNAFLKMLSEFRPATPLNGVILVIPCGGSKDDAKGDQDEGGGLLEDPPELIRSKAARIRDALLTICRRTEAQFPVYLVLTKADKIFGFAESVHRLEADSREQMFGWSRAAEDFEKPFDMREFQRAFAVLVRRAHLLRAKSLSDARVPDALSEVDRMFAFPEELKNMQPAVETYVQQIFGESSLVDRLFFRGFYLSSGLQKGKPVAAACAALMGKTSEADRRDLEGLFGRPRAYFIRDLIQRRIFVERGLVRPTSARVRKSRMAILATTAAAAGLAVIGTVVFAVANFGSSQKPSEVVEATSVFPELRSYLDLDPAELTSAERYRLLIGKLEKIQETIDIDSSLTDFFDATKPEFEKLYVDLFDRDFVRVARAAAAEHVLGQLPVKAQEVSLEDFLSGALPDALFLLQPINVGHKESERTLALLLKEAGLDASPGVDENGKELETPYEETLRICREHRGSAEWPSVSTRPDDVGRDDLVALAERAEGYFGAWATDGFPDPQRWDAELYPHELALVTLLFRDGRELADIVERLGGFLGKWQATGGGVSTDEAGTFLSDDRDLEAKEEDLRQRYGSSNSKSRNARLLSPELHERWYTLLDERRAALADAHESLTEKKRPTSPAWKELRALPLELFQTLRDETRFTAHVTWSPGTHFDTGERATRPTQAISRRRTGRLSAVLSLVGFKKVGVGLNKAQRATGGVGSIPGISADDEEPITVGELGIAGEWSAYGRWDSDFLDTVRKACQEMLEQEGVFQPLTLPERIARHFTEKSRAGLDEKWFEERRSLYAERCADLGALREALDILAADDSLPHREVAHLAKLHEALHATLERAPDAVRAGAERWKEQVVGLLEKELQDCERRVETLDTTLWPRNGILPGLVELTELELPMELATSRDRVFAHYLARCRGALLDKWRGDETDTRQNLDDLADHLAAVPRQVVKSDDDGTEAWLTEVDGVLAAELAKQSDALDAEWRKRFGSSAVREASAPVDFDYERLKSAARALRARFDEDEDLSVVDEFLDVGSEYERALGGIEGSPVLQPNHVLHKTRDELATIVSYFDERKKLGSSKGPTFFRESLKHAAAVTNSRKELETQELAVFLERVRTEYDGSGGLEEEGSLANGFFTAPVLAYRDALVDVVESGFVSEFRKLLGDNHALLRSSLLNPPNDPEIDGSKTTVRALDADDHASRLEALLHPIKGSLAQLRASHGGIEDPVSIPWSAAGDSGPELGELFLALLSLGEFLYGADGESPMPTLTLLPSQYADEWADFGNRKGAYEDIRDEYDFWWPPVGAFLSTGGLVNAGPIPFENWEQNPKLEMTWSDTTAKERPTARLEVESQLLPLRLAWHLGTPANGGTEPSDTWKLDVPLQVLSSTGPVQISLPLAIQFDRPLPVLPRGIKDLVK